MAGKRERSVLFWLFFLFGTSVLVRFYLAYRFGGINDFTMEIKYWTYSRNFFLGEPLEFRGVPVSDMDFLYPLVISAAHFVKNFDGMYCVILLINTLLSSSVVFPVYLLAEKVLNNKMYSFGMVLASISVPEMFYSAKILQENLYYPYTMWMFYLFYSFLLPQKYSRKRAALFVLFLCASFYIKSAGACLMASFLLFYFIQIFFCKNRKQKAICVGIIIQSTCLCVTLDTLISFLWLHTIDESTIGIVISRIKQAVIRASNISIYGSISLSGILFIVVMILLFISFIGMKLSREYPKIVRHIILVFAVLVAIIILYLIFHHKYFYSSLTYMAYNGLFWGIVVPIIPIAYMNMLEEYKRDLLIFSILAWLVVIAAVCLTVLVGNTEIRDGTVRLHYRFIYHLFIPFLIMFFYSLNKIHILRTSWIFPLISIIYAGITAVSMPAASWGISDAPSLSFWERLLALPQGELLIKGFIILVLLAGNLLIFFRYTKELRNCAYILLITIFIINSVTMYQKNATECIAQNTAATLQDGKKIAEYLSNREDIRESTDVLLAATDTTNYGLMEICINVPYRLCLWRDLLALAETNNGDLPFVMLDLYQKLPNAYHSFSSSRISTNNAFKYMVTQGPLTLTQYHMVDLDLKDYYLWEHN